MRKLVILAIAAMFSISALAQEKQKRTPEQRAEKVTNKMKEKLNLTDEQVQKIKAINLDAAQKKDTLKVAAKKDAKEKIKAIEKERDAKIREQLTEEQKAKYDKMKESAKEKVKDRRKKKAEGTDTDDDE